MSGEWGIKKPAAEVVVRRRARFRTMPAG